MISLLIKQMCSSSQCCICHDMLSKFMEYHYCKYSSITLPSDLKVVSWKHVARREWNQTSQSSGPAESRWWILTCSDYHWYFAGNPWVAMPRSRFFRLVINACRCAIFPKKNTCNFIIMSGFSFCRSLGSSWNPNHIEGNGIWDLITRVSLEFRNVGHPCFYSLV